MALGIELPTGKKVIGCRWVFAVKLNPDDSVERKARLIAKEYAHTYGVDYSDTFSPIAKITYVRLFISPVRTLISLILRVFFFRRSSRGSVYEATFRVCCSWGD